ncbi:MAG: YbjQ family protein [Firmicutes bacterium]|nr:YbjQ family protein [Bacillota bacterium]
MKLSTTEYITGKELEHLGLVIGNVVQTKNIAKDFKAIGRTFVGGEIKDYTDLLKEARGIATERMVKEAENMGADAIVAVRYATSNIMDTASEVMVYGTAVKFM